MLEEGYGGEKSEAFFAARAKLASGTPLAYLIGYTPFLNCKIWLDSKPLIPRPETEFWVEKAKNHISSHQTNKNQTVKILDLCAGSGCIGIAIAKNIPATTVDFIEIDSNHHQTIAKNCLENKISGERYQIFSGDLYSPLCGQTYDFILSNPPYIDKKLNRVASSVKSNEPALALYGGDDGMELIAKIIKASPHHLLPAGQLWLEHEPEQVEAINSLSQDKFKIVNHKDQYGVLRFSQLVLK